VDATMGCGASHEKKNVHSDPTFTVAPNTLLMTPKPMPRPPVIIPPSPMILPQDPPPPLREAQVIRKQQSQPFLQPLSLQHLPPLALEPTSQGEEQPQQDHTIPDTDTTIHLPDIHQHKQTTPHKLNTPHIIQEHNEIQQENKYEHPLTTQQEIRYSTLILSDDMENVIETEKDKEIEVHDYNEAEPLSIPEEPQITNVARVLFPPVKLTRTTTLVSIYESKEYQSVRTTISAQRLHKKVSTYMTRRESSRALITKSSSGLPPPTERESGTNVNIQSNNSTIARPSST